jgi:hypothetical protein
MGNQNVVYFIQFQGGNMYWYILQHEWAIKTLCEVTNQTEKATYHMSLFKQISRIKEIDGMQDWR